MIRLVSRENIGVAAMVAALIVIFWLGWVIDGQPAFKDMMSGFGDLLMDMD